MAIKKKMRGRSAAALRELRRKYHLGEFSRKAKARRTRPRLRVQRLSLPKGRNPTTEAMKDFSAWFGDYLEGTQY